MEEGRAAGATRGCALVQASPRSASVSAALLAQERSSPREGGGGRRDVSGTADCQSW